MTEHRSTYHAVEMLPEKREQAAKIIAAEERERLRTAYGLMTRVFFHVPAQVRIETMRLLRQMHDGISERFDWPPIDGTTGRGD